MTSTAKRLMVRVIERRIVNGENFDDIIRAYPKLTLAEVKELREAVGA